MGYRNYGPSNGFIVSKDGNGDFKTIAAALTAATSGITIFIKPGTYTENLTLVGGVNLTAFGSDSSQNGTGNVIISGTCTLNTSGSVSISGIQLQTNSAAFLTVSGSSASIVNIENCYLNCTNNTGITFSSSSASAAINITNCKGNLGTTGIAIFTQSSAGVLFFYDTDFSNSGGSSTANTVSAGSFFARRTTFFNPMTTSGTATTTCDYCGFNSLSQNVTALTQGGSGNSSFFKCTILSGSASAVSISNTTGIYDCNISSSNTNAVTGAGTVQYSTVTFSGTSTTINTTTQSIAGTLQGSKNTAPTGGFLGEQIRAFATGVSTSTNAVTNITSISMTAGIWDVSCVANATGSAFAGNSFQAGISTTNNTFTGNTGDNNSIFGFNTGSLANANVTIAAYRVVLSSTTTYFLNGNYVFGSGTATLSGRISATRVG
jgi:hypothetical protein